MKLQDPHPESRTTEDIVDLLTDAFKLRTEVSRVLMAHNLSVTQWMMLVLLDKSGRQLQADLAKSLGVTDELVSMYLTEPLARGLVARVLNAADKRQRPLGLAEEGRALVAVIEAGLAEADILTL